MKLDALLREAADRYADVDKRNPGIPDSFPVKVGGREYHVRMSPWMWMRPWEAKEKMGFAVALKPNAVNAESHFFRDVPAPKGYLGAKKADVAKVVTAWLADGGAEELDRLAGEWAGARSAFAAASKDEAAADAKRDAEQKAAGMTHRVDAWIHPRRGGRDVAISWYADVRPAHDDVKAELKRRGSVDTSDYKIVAL